MSYNPNAIKFTIRRYSADHTVTIDELSALIAFEGGGAQNCQIDVMADAVEGDVFYVAQWGAGAVTLVAGVGVTIQVESALGLVLNSQWAECRLTYAGSDVWVANGSLKA